MKSRSKKIWTWVVGSGICLMMIGAVIAKGAFGLAVGTINSNRTFLHSFVSDYFSGKSVDDRILAPNIASVRQAFEKVLKEKGKFVSIGEADNIPIASDLLHRCKELSYNFPVTFEHGTATFTFRVRNEKSGQKVMWAAVADGILPPESFRKRVTGQLPESSYKNSPRW